MSDLLELLGFKKRIRVGISLSLNNFIELTVIDDQSKCLEKYVSSEVKYNSAIKEIIDYAEFEEVVEDLFDRAGLKPEECSVTLCLPNVHFGVDNIEGSGDSGYILENIQEEIEDLYIFKRNEPIITFVQTSPSTAKSQKKIAYGAMQSKVISKLISIFENLQTDLIRIDSSYTAMLRAIQYTDRFNKFVQPEERTLIININSLTCATFLMNGNVINKFEEEPLAVKSLSVEEVYGVVSRIIETAIDNNSPKSVLIISETEEINAEILVSRIKFEGETDFVNKIIDENNPLIQVSDFETDVDSSMLQYMTVESIGSAVADYDYYPVSLNFLPSDRVDKDMISMGEYEVNLKRFICLTLGLSILLAVILGFILQQVLKSQSDNFETEIRSNKSKIQVFDQKNSVSQKVEMKNIFPLMKQIVERNKNILTIYNALSTEIPDGIYIKRFVTNNNDGIGIIGEAEKSEAINPFAEALAQKNSDLSLKSISVNTENDPVPGNIPNGFTFAIKTSNIEINADTPATTIYNSIPGASSNSAAKSKDNKSGGYSSLTPPPPMI